MPCANLLPAPPHCLIWVSSVAQVKRTTLRNGLLQVAWVLQIKPALHPHSRVKMRHDVKSYASAGFGYTSSLLLVLVSRSICSTARASRSHQSSSNPACAVSHHTIQYAIQYRGTVFLITLYEVNFSLPLRTDPTSSPSNFLHHAK